MDARHLARILSYARVAVGGALVASPSTVGRVWLGKGVREPASLIALRAMGVRDLAIGLAVARSLDEGEDPSGLLGLGVVCDAVDGLATLSEIRRLPASRSTLAITAVTAAAVAGLVARSGIRLGAPGGI